MWSIKRILQKSAWSLSCFFLSAGGLFLFLFLPLQTAAALPAFDPAQKPHFDWRQLCCPSLDPSQHRDAPTPKEEAVKEVKPLPDVPQEKTVTIRAEGIMQEKIQVKNETDYEVDPKACLSEPLWRHLQGEPPSVLILHTHATEAYMPTTQTAYAPSGEYRTVDPERNMTSIGRRVAEKLCQNGIDAMQDATLNDYPIYSYSYKNSLALAEHYIELYPDLSWIVDLHRDAMQTEDGAWVRTVCDLPDGSQAAQIMIVVGTDAGGLWHPNWRKNFTLAVHLQAALEARYPGITRPINIRRERFNGHVGHYQLLIEIGTNGNTWEEAAIAADCLADAMTAVLKEP